MKNILRTEMILFPKKLMSFFAIALLFQVCAAPVQALDLSKDAANVESKFNEFVENEKNKERKKKEEAVQSYQRATDKLNNGRCNFSEVCYDVVKQEGNELRIVCRNSGKNGIEESVCVNKKGKWAAGCGVSDMFAFHFSSAEKAIERACD